MCCCQICKACLSSFSLWDMLIFELCEAFLTIKIESIIKNTLVFLVIVLKRNIISKQKCKYNQNIRHRTWFKCWVCLWASVRIVVGVNREKGVVMQWLVQLIDRIICYGLYFKHQWQGGWHRKAEIWAAVCTEANKWGLCPWCQWKYSGLWVQQWVFRSHEI